MGLDAYVHCRCLADGLHTEPPIPVEWIAVDSDGVISPIPPHDDNETVWAIDRWTRDCCQHPDMDEACEYLSNWSGYRKFQAALRHAGWQHFPALHDHLPNNNGGRMPAPAAAQALAELAYFPAADLGTVTELLDEDSNSVIDEYIESYDGVVYLHRDYQAGVDPDGFFVRHGEQTVFRSLRFEQVERAGGVALVDGAHSVEWRTSPIGTPAAKRLCVRTRTQIAAEFDYIVEPLHKVLEASVRTGNPVHWC
jgi:hypothetical protein